LVILSNKRTAEKRKPYITFACSNIGASQIKNGKPCQDASSYGEGKKYRFIAVADGHGGDPYFRSSLGSHFAIEALRSCVFDNQVAKSLYSNANEKDLERMILQLKKSIISRWNTLVAADMEAHPFTDEELNAIPEKIADEYRAGEFLENAYGTTLISVLWTDNLFLALHIGDGTCVILNNEAEFTQPLPIDEKCFLGVTTSLCDKNAIESFRHYFTKDPPIATIIGTDGIDDCFAGAEKLYDFYRIILSSFIDNELRDAQDELIDYLPRLSEKGSGDDVSIGIIIDNEMIRKVNLETGSAEKDGH
jgi:serine/threonine protein phosphatase PrpC